MNLFLNALDAASIDGQIRVYVNTDSDAEMPAGGREHRFHDTCLIKVVDDGPGLPEEIGDRIFDPFVSTKDSGMGLGLSICKRIVEAHAGKITAENGSGAGSQFSVRLPLMDNRPFHKDAHHAHRTHC